MLTTEPHSIESAEYYRQREKRKARAGDMACLVFHDLENK